MKTELNSLPFCLHHIFWSQTAGEHRIRLVKHINLWEKSSWNDPWQTSIYTSMQLFFQYWSQLCFLTAMILSPAVYRSAVVSIACVSPYIVTWKFQICGNMANEMRNYFRKLPWDNKEEVWSLVCNSVYQWNVSIALLVLVEFLNALCAYGGCSFSFQIWCLETHKAGKLLKL